MENTQAYPVGTVVLVNSFRPIYGIVIDREFWLQETAKEDLNDVEYFLDGEKKIGQNMMIPVFFFGNIIDDKLVEVDGENVEKKYVKKHGYSNVGGDIHIIGGGVSQLLNIMWHIRQFTKGSVEYIEGALHDIKALDIYFDGGYDIKSDKLSPAYRSMITLYERALPGLAGKDYCGT